MIGLSIWGLEWLRTRIWWDASWVWRWFSSGHHIWHRDRWSFCRNCWLSMSYLLPDVSWVPRSWFPYSWCQFDFVGADWSVLGFGFAGLWWLRRSCVEVGFLSRVQFRSGLIWMLKFRLALDSQIGFVLGLLLISLTFIVIFTPIFLLSLPAFLPEFNFLSKKSPRILSLISVTDCSVPTRSLTHESPWSHYLCFSFLQVHSKENRFIFDSLQRIPQVIELAITN